MEINLVSVGILLVIAGFVIILVSSLSGKDVKVGVGGFIGPFAFGWANDPEMGRWIIVLSAIMAVIFLIAFLKGVLL